MKVAALLQAGLGLAMVLGLVFLCAWLARRFGLQPAAGRGLKVVAGAAVGQRERVVVIEIGGTWLVLGVGGGHVNHLHTLPAQIEPAPAPLNPAMPPAFAVAGAFGQKFRAAVAELKGRA